MNLDQDKICPFSRGDFVKFSEIQGMTELNHSEQPFRIISTGKFNFTIDCDTTKFSSYTMNGIAEEVKVPFKLEFRSLEHCVKRPVPAGSGGLICPDLAKLSRSEMLHFAIQSIYEYQVICR